MANNRGYGGPNVMLMRTESSSTDTLVAMLASCSPVAMQVPRSVGGLEDAVVGCGQKRSFYPTFENVEEPGDDDVGDDCTHNVEKKRRLTFDQVRSLERNFELENKLEPERKMQLAKELGLQPRQVAVWFQNRRARWKTKQLERDYEVLTLDYNRLKSDFDSVLQEKQELQAEIECLTGKLKTQEQPSSEALESSKCESASHLSPKKVSEVSVKSERVTELVTSREPLPARKEKDARATSSDSTSSEILDADSPRTIDSGLSVAPTDKTNICPQIATDISLESNIMYIADELCEGVLSPQACHQRTAVKLEEGNFPEDSCNYLLTQLDEQGALPWWDWP